LAVEVPKGYFMQLVARSSLNKKGFFIGNSVGIIDSDYRGEILVVFDIINQDLPIYEVGERCCQMDIVPIIQVEFEEVRELSESKRGSKGFGSSGK
jgi:dUTP pyrophosphatase